MAQWQRAGFIPQRPVVGFHLPQPVSPLRLAQIAGGARHLVHARAPSRRHPSAVSPTQLRGNSGTPARASLRRKQITSSHLALPAGANANLYIMSVHSVASVSEQPQLTLERWRVYETSKGERHFVGYCIETREGRVTTAILSFDIGARIGVTASGRRYRLSGWPCFDSDAELVWSHLASQGVSKTNDVSMEYLPPEGVTA